MYTLNLSDLEIGSVYQVQSPHDYPHPERKTFLGMVVSKGYRSVEVASIEIDSQRVPMLVSQDQIDPELRNSPLRRILQPFPQFRRFADDPDALLCFNEERDAVVPTGLSLDELLRHDGGKFIIGSHRRRHALYRTDACFRNPFRDLTVEGKAVWQHVTVFELDRDAKMVRGESSDYAYRVTLPDHATYHKVDAGHVITGEDNLLTLGQFTKQRRTHELYRGTRFAVETGVLVRAGLADAA